MLRPMNMVRPFGRHVSTDWIRSHFAWPIDYAGQNQPGNRRIEKNSPQRTRAPKKRTAQIQNRNWNYYKTIFELCKQIGGWQAMGKWCIECTLHTTR
jgi:hypothetical protein